MRTVAQSHRRTGDIPAGTHAARPTSTHRSHDSHIIMYLCMYYDNCVNRWQILSTIAAALLIYACGWHSPAVGRVGGARVRDGHGRGGGAGRASGWALVRPLVLVWRERHAHGRSPRRSGGATRMACRRLFCYRAKCPYRIELAFNSTDVSIVFYCTDSDRKGRYK